MTCLSHLILVRLTKDTCTDVKCEGYHHYAFQAVNMVSDYFEICSLNFYIFAQIESSAVFWTLTQAKCLVAVADLRRRPEGSMAVPEGGKSN